MKTIKQSILVLAASLVAGLAFASSGGPQLDKAPADRLDGASLQRGAQAFINNCLSCHTASFMRYGRLTDIGFTEQQIREGFVPPGGKIGDTMGNAMSKTEAKAWFGAVPPDLSVIARARGKDWLYGYLRGFYVDEAKPTGWNNLVFKDVGMPHVLWQLSGKSKLVETEYASHEEAAGAQAKAKGLSEIVEHRETKDGKESVKFVLRAIEPGQGAMAPDQYNAYAADLVNFLDYMAEPAKNKRIALGYVVLAFLAVLFVFAYRLKKEYWKDVH